MHLSISYYSTFSIKFSLLGYANKDNFRNKKYSGKNNFSIVVGSVTYIGSGGVKLGPDTNNALIANANDPDHADYINAPATCEIFDATTDAGVVTVVEFTPVP